jgi:electron transfer flavoprotein-quinone oxidoreductase
MSAKLWDVIIVGGGPAGITAALRLAREDLDILVVEAAVYPGAENWSGAVYFAENLADPKVLGVDGLEAAPYEGRVVKRGFFSCNGLSMAGLEYENPETFKHCYTVLRPVYDRYLAEVARREGVTFLTETTVDGLIRRNDRVVGVHTDRGPVYGQIVFLAEGDASHLVSKEGFEGDAVRAKKNGQPAFLQGVKEVIQLEPEVIEDRFGVGPGEACCYEILLRNGVVDGKPVRLNMAGLLYTNRNSVSIGLVMPLDNLAEYRGDYNALMEWYKSLPPIARLIEGGEATSFGAKIIRSGGLAEMPRLVADGVVVGGAATGIGVDFPYPNFTGPATAMGRIFADAVLKLQSEGAEPRSGQLEELYVQPLKETSYYKDVDYLRDWPGFIEHTDALFSRQIDLLNGSSYAMTRPTLRFPHSWWETVRVVSETMKGRWSKTLKDLAGGSKALRMGRLIAKHMPAALLLSVPNTLLALMPFAYGKGPGKISLSFWVDGEESRTLPWYKRWSYARYRSALMKATAIVYANDGVPIRTKLDRAIGTLLRRFSLWEIVLGVLGVAVFWLTRGLQKLSDAIRYSRKKPTIEELTATFYGSWLTRWRAMTDLARAASTGQTHDAKLGEISYGGDVGSHIKVFFPPDKPGTLEDPSRSALWSVCPASVYQINVDRTMHASVAVNFENCVKCETCWRIEPQHVDWSRFGKHRLTYEVYTDADASLRQLLSERELRDTPEIEPSFWSATLTEAWPVGHVEASDALRSDITNARRAIDRAAAKCSELSDNIWLGPRVLEPGQVSWYISALEYFAVLADEAASVALSEPIEDWLIEHELAGAHLELLQAKRDLDLVTRGIREHAGSQKFFAGEADARQAAGHHLAGMREIIDRIALACRIPDDYVDPVAELRNQEQESPARAAAREELREHLAAIFDRGAIRRLEDGGSPEGAEIEALRESTRAALGDETQGAFDSWAPLTRSDILGELSRIDPSLAILVAGHLEGLAALEGAGATAKVIGPLKKVEVFVTLATEVAGQPGDGKWNGALPFALTALADRFVSRGEGQVAVFGLKSKGVKASITPAIGLTGAAASEILLKDAKPMWSGDWTEADETELFAARVRDAAAIALGSATILTERAIDHARSRIQFPDMFQDLDGRDGVGKFGAVRAHLSHIEASRLAIETILNDCDWTADSDLEAMVGKVAVTDLFGPDMPSITYRAGQVIGGSAFSEEDIFSKAYRDSSVFTHYIRENAELNVEIGSRISAGDGSLLATIAPDLSAALDVVARRPIFDFEVNRLREAEMQLAENMRGVLSQGQEPAVAEVVHDIAGELVTRLYVWARLMVRAYRRLEGALPAQRYLEAVQLWADIIEERLLGLEDELAQSAARIELGTDALQLDAYPDEPIATSGLDFDLDKDVIKGEVNYRSGDFLLKPFRIDETRYTPELQWVDDVTRNHYDEYLKEIRERFQTGRYKPSFERETERLHCIPREDIDWTVDRGYFRVVIPEEYGGQGRSKADYYNLCQIAKRHGDVSLTLTIQANTSIGTTPMLLGLDEVIAAERDLAGAVARAADVEAAKSEIEKLIEMMSMPDVDALAKKYMEIDKSVRSSIGKSRILKKVVFGKFQSAWGKAGAAGMKKDLVGFRKGLEKAVVALGGWQERVAAELDEMPRRRMAHEFFLRLISSRITSAFSLTEPSAGSDTARVRTEARLDSRSVLTDDDGVKHFYLDEDDPESRRNLADMRRFEFDGRRILYRYSDDADPAEVHSQEYTYSEDEEKYRYFMIGDRRVDIHDMAIVRERDGEEVYEFFVLNGAKMWITNGHIAGVNAIYARTPMGLTGFMVDALTDGFLVGKDEEKTGQRGSPTNEIGLTNVRIPRECMIGIEGRGQENALETLNVGRTGLCISSTAGIDQAIGDATAYLEETGRNSSAGVRYRLGLTMEEMYAVESIAYNLVGIYDDKTSDMPRVESSIAKLFGTEGLHRMLHFLEPVYGIDGQTQRYRIEKDRRDARVMTIYEGTNEIQQFLLLKDVIDMVGPRLDKLEELDVSAEDSVFKAEVDALREMHAAVRERVKETRATYKSAAWQRALLQPVFFRLARMVALLKTVDSVLHRADWVARNLTADADAFRRSWSDKAARGFVARARREFMRLATGFDRDFETLKAGGRTAELKLAETLLDETEIAAAHGKAGTGGIERSPIDRGLEIVVALERAPHLAPRPRVIDGELAEHVYGFTAGDRRALSMALALKSASPERVRVTLVCAAPVEVEDALRAGLAAGADRAILIDTRGELYEEHSVADAITGVLRQRNIDPDLLLSGASEDGPSGGRLGLRLASELDIEWAPNVTELWVDGSTAVVTSERFPDSLIKADLPVAASVAGSEGEPAPEFTAAGFAEALRKDVDAVPFPDDAERADEELATTSAQATTESHDDAGRIDPERAAELLVEVGDLGDGSAVPTGEPHAGAIESVSVDSLDWRGVVFIAEIEDDNLVRDARAPLEAASGLAERSSLPLSGLVLSERLSDDRRRAIAGRLAAHAPFGQIVFAEHDALGDGAYRAYVEALEKLVGPESRTRPTYLVSSPWLADAMPPLAEVLRRSDVDADELAGVSRVEFRDGDGVAFVQPAYERKLRARRHLPYAADAMRILWFEPEVTSEPGEATSSDPTVVVVGLDLDYDPQTDALTEALLEAKKALGVVTLENAEFVIDVGAGLGSVDNLDTVVEPLRQALLELGAPHVLIGATRKVTIDMSWLPEELQVGQTGVRVNPRIMIALGVSGAPQHIDWVGDRAVIFAFNMDAQAPLMTLNQRREQPKVYPIVGNLLETVPRFIKALKHGRD